MREGLIHLGLSFIIGLIGFCSLSYAQGAKQLAWVSCKQSHSLGLFEQCQSVKILQRIGNHIRAYGYHSQRLINVPDNEVFQMLSTSNISTIPQNHILLIPGSLIWSDSSEQVQMICRSKQMSRSNYLDLDCGETKAQKVNKELVYFLGKSYRQYKPAKKSPASELQSKKSYKKDG